MTTKDIKLLLDLAMSEYEDATEALSHLRLAVELLSDCVDAPTFNLLARLDSIDRIFDNVSETLQTASRHIAIIKEVMDGVAE